MMNQATLDSLLVAVNEMHTDVEVMTWDLKITLIAILISFIFLAGLTTYFFTILIEIIGNKQ